MTNRLTEKDAYCAKMQQNEAFNTVIYIVNVDYYMSMLVNTANNNISTNI